MVKIITHGGNAHLDDLMACTLAVVNETWFNLETGFTSVEDALSTVCKDTLIERREPTKEELEDPQVLVLDVGGHYRPAMGNFDHHQFPRGTKESAMSLFAASIGMPNSAFNGAEEYIPEAEEYPMDSLASFLEDAYPWFRTRVELDAYGPFATAKSAGTEWGTVEKFLGPCEDIVLKAFEDATPETRAMVVRPLAEMIIRKHAAWVKVTCAVKYYRSWRGDDGFTIADFTSANPDDAESCSDMITKYVEGVAVFHDNRGEGLAILRLHDNPRIDFTRVKDDPEVAFCHSNGFLVKTKTKDLDKAWRLIEGACTDK